MPGQVTRGRVGVVEILCPKTSETWRESKDGGTHKQKVSVPNHPPRIYLISHSNIPYRIAWSQHMQNARPLKFGFALDHTRIRQPVLWRRHENPE